jgi:hypothetical protein
MKEVRKGGRYEGRKDVMMEGRTVKKARNERTNESQKRTPL